MCMHMQTYKHTHTHHMCMYLHTYKHIHSHTCTCIHTNTLINIKYRNKGSIQCDHIFRLPGGLLHGMYTSALNLLKTKWMDTPWISPSLSWKSCLLSKDKAFPTPGLACHHMPALSSNLLPGLARCSLFLRRHHPESLPSPPGCPNCFSMAMTAIPARIWDLLSSVLFIWPLIHT